MTETDTQRIEEFQAENRRLRRAVDELAILNDLALDIGGSTDSEEIMRTVVGKSIRAIGAEQGDITLVDSEESDRASTLVRSIVSSADQSPLHLNQNLLGWMQINRKPLLINEPAIDPRFRYVEWDRSVRSVLCAPMMVKSKLIGILTIYNKKLESGFKKEDQRLLSIIAAQSGQIVENARLHEEEQKLIEMRKEMDVAAEIQRQLLPRKSPDIDGYSICGKNITARAVGGDYFDFIQVAPYRWGITLGDVSGKGLPASLLMANLQASLRGQILHDLSPAELLAYSNKLLHQSTSAEKFATVFLAILDASTHALHYSSAGHEYPYLVRADGSLERLKTGGVPLGMFSSHTYEEASVALSPADHLFIFSDGITDSMNAEEETFGEERLEQVLAAHAGDANSKALMDDVFAKSIEHSGKTDLFDDLTVVVLSRIE